MPRPKLEIDPTKCPHSDRPYYANGMCRSCYRAIKEAGKRQEWDAKYQQSTKGQKRSKKADTSEYRRGYKAGHANGKSLYPIAEDDYQIGYNAGVKARKKKLKEERKRTSPADDTTGKDTKRSA